MAKIQERERAHTLRKRGWSIRKIATYLGVSKSTASYWCRDIPLTQKQTQRLQAHQESAAIKALLAYAEKRRAVRMESTKQQRAIGAKDISRFESRDLFFLGLGLYWGEGYKKGNQEVGFTNSDPVVIQLMLRWFVEMYGITPDRFVLRVSINELHREREQKVLQYWSRITSLPLSQFTKTSFITARQQKVYEKPEEHFGTLRVKIRGGSSLKHRILGSLAAIGSFVD